jgi:DinB superfamily
MDQQDETTRQALSYVRHQASKSLGELRVLAERTGTDWSRCLEGISEEQARFKPGDEWSVKEVLDHLIYATAHVVIEPIRDLGAGRSPRPFTPDSSGGRTMQPIGELREEMARLLEEAVVMIDALPQRSLAPGTWEHPTLGPLNLHELIALHRLHVMDHVQQIQKIKADPGYPPDRGVQALS